MPEVLIQVVDENDNPLYGVKMHQVWRTGEKHRIVWIIVEDEQGRILLQKRPKTMPLYPGRWDNSVGGHVDEGETYEQAAKREALEELGLSDIKLKELGKFYKESEFEGRKLNRFYKAYKMIIDPKQVSYDKHEIEEVRWFSVDEIKQMIKTTPGKATNGLEQTMGMFYS